MKNLIRIGVFQYEVNRDGTIDSGPMVSSFTVESLDQVKAELERRVGGQFSACYDGEDGAFENSGGAYGPCMVSMVVLWNWQRA